MVGNWNTQKKIIEDEIIVIIKKNYDGYRIIDNINFGMKRSEMIFYRNESKRNIEFIFEYNRTVKMIIRESNKETSSIKAFKFSEIDNIKKETISLIKKLKIMDIFNN